MTPRDVVLAGVGVVSPLGCDAAEFARRLVAGERGFRRELRFESRRSDLCFSPPNFDVNEIISSPRLRRVGPITQFACAAAALALRHAKLPLRDKAAMRRVGVVTAVAHGGITVTRQFHAELTQQGPRGVSPMLFPETVYNAPSSHLAALLGCDHVNYTIVGDAAAAFTAVAMGCDLLESGGVEHCLVVGAEEADGAAAAAYRRFGQRFFLGEGAGAVLLAKGKSGIARIVEADRGRPFHSRAERKKLAADADDGLTAQLGEAFTAGAMWRLIAAALSLARRPSPAPPLPIRCVGLNQQASTVILAPV